MTDGGRALGVLSAAIESAEQVAKQGGDAQGGRSAANAVKAPATAALSSSVDRIEDDSTGMKMDEEDTGIGDDKENGGEAESAETAAPISDENLSYTQSIASLESPYTVWHGEDYASKSQRSRHNQSRNGSTGSRSGGGRGSRSVGNSGINSAGAPFVPLLCWQAARISMLRADTHRRKLAEARLFSRPVPMGSVNSLKSAWLAAKGYLEKGLQCPFPTATAASASSSSGHGSSCGPDHHLQVLLAWHLAALAAQGPPPGISNSNISSSSSKGASVDFEVDGRRSASHFAFAKSALLAAAAAAAVSSRHASARMPGSSTTTSSLSAAPAMSGGAAAAVRAARSTNNYSSKSGSRLSPRLAQSQASPLPLLTTPERCFQLVFALARADSRAGRRCAAASAMRASLRRGCGHLWARHVLLTLALQHAVDQESSDDASSSSFGADGAVAGVYDDDADALAAAEAAAKVGDGGVLFSVLLYCVVSCFFGISQVSILGHFQSFTCELEYRSSGIRALCRIIVSPIKDLHIDDSIEPHPLFQFLLCNILAIGPAQARACTEAGRSLRGQKRYYIREEHHHHDDDAHRRHVCWVRLRAPRDAFIELRTRWRLPVCRSLIGPASSSTTVS